MLTRRAALKSAAAAGAFAAVGPVSIGLAAAPTDRRLVVLILRGGADGLALVPAPGDPAHAARRGQLAEQEAIDLDGHFALHPKFSGLGALWREGQLAVVHAAQTGYRNRSHFDAQDMLENGLNTLSGVADGWLNRALGYFDDGAPRRGLAAGYGTPLILRGKTPIATWAPRRLPRPDPGFLAKLQAISGPDRQIGKALDAGVKMAETNRALLGRLEAGGPGSATSRSAIADLARATGRLLSATAGARVAALEIGGWDTHGYQNIALSYRVPYLDDALVALKDGLGAAWAKSVIIVVTEFGRTARPNGTNGTDHGTAGAVLVLGGAVRGGRVIADWPGLERSSLYQGRDLMATTDIRAIFKGAMIEHLGIDAAFVEARVFPESRSIRPLENLAVS